jgi:hypothetical protein
VPAALPLPKRFCWHRIHIQNSLKTWKAVSSVSHLSRLPLSNTTSHIISGNLSFNNSLSKEWQLFSRCNMPLIWLYCWLWRSLKHDRSRIHCQFYLASARLGPVLPKNTLQTIWFPWWAPLKALCRSRDFWSRKLIRISTVASNRVMIRKSRVFDPTASI